MNFKPTGPGTRLTRNFILQKTQKLIFILKIAHKVNGSTARLWQLFITKMPTLRLNGLILFVDNFFPKVTSFY